MLIKKIKEFYKKIFPVKEMSEDKYCRSRVIYNSEDNFILLLSFSKEYFLDTIELLDNTNNLEYPLSTKLKSSSYEEIIKDSEGNDRIIIHDKYYLLIGGEVKAWICLYENSNNLGNELLKIISKDISNVRIQSEFESLINDCVMHEFLYKSDINDVKKRYDKDITETYVDGEYKYDYRYSDIELIISRIPNSFNLIDLLDFIIINYDLNTRILTARMSLKFALYCNDAKNLSDEEFNKFKSSIDYLVLNKLFNSIDINNNYLKLLLGPVYKQPDDLSIIPGSIDDESLDDIFKKEYERFSITNENDIIYDSIDKISEDNILEVDDSE